MFQLGGHALFLSNAASQIGRGEPVQDTARVLSRYCDGIMIRTYAQQEVEDLAQYGSIPVINGLTDFCHPCQVLADLMDHPGAEGQAGGAEDLLHRRRQQYGQLHHRRRPEVRHGRVRGLPRGLPPRTGRSLDFAKTVTDAKFVLTGDPMEAARDADVVFTDVWASMGQEQEKAQRERAFAGYQVNDALMAVAKPDCMVQHCLPAHREEEITEAVFEAHAGEIFEEAENRLHAQKAVMALLMR